MLADRAFLHALLRYLRRLERDVREGILVEGLARWQPRLQQMSLNPSLGSLCEFEFGKGCQQARRRPALTMCRLPDHGRVAGTRS